MKDANTVISIIHHNLHCEITLCHTNNKVKVLKTHVGNCAGQNKKRFMLFFWYWRTIIGINEDVSLDCIAAVQFKKGGDGAFGQVKWKLESKNARIPRKVMKVVEMSSNS